MAGAGVGLALRGPDFRNRRGIGGGYFGGMDPRGFAGARGLGRESYLGLRRGPQVFDPSLLGGLRGGNWGPDPFGRGGGLSGLRGRDPYEQLLGGPPMSGLRGSPFEMGGQLGAFPARRYPPYEPYGGLGDYYARGYGNGLGLGGGLGSCSCSLMGGRECFDPWHARCSGHGSSSCGSKEYTFKTKDMTVRGKSYKVRASYLTDNTKFEADLIKYMEKKKDDQVPDRVVGMLIDFINGENYENHDPLDEVTLNILASNVGCKSAGAFSLGRLKNAHLDPEMLARLSGPIFLSTKVDDDLKSWFDKCTKEDEMIRAVAHQPIFRLTAETHPEVKVEIEKRRGLRRQDEDEDIRII
jgi:hypothetical protein